jgi:N-acetylmuramoyl-L-alanine amidase
VLAHLQHLYAYASTKPLTDGYPLVDPRFNHVARGSAPTWVGFNGKWAVPGTTYGQSIDVLLIPSIKHLRRISCTKNF